MSETTTPVIPSASNQLVDRARAGFDQVQADPGRAEDTLRAVLAAAGIEPTRATVIARWGLARLMHTAGDFEQAADFFEQAIGDAVHCQLPDDLANIRVSASVTHQTLGHTDRALHELDLAEPFLTGTARGRWSGQRALVLLNLGQTHDAIRAFDIAIRSLTDGDDRVALARTHLNRAVAHLHHNAYTAARADLHDAHRIAAADGEQVVAASALHNLGYLEARLGRIPAALRAFEDARTTFLALGNAGRLLAVLDADHVEVCLAVGLVPEALDIADRLIAAAERSRDLLQLGEARLLRARALSMLHDFDRAAMEAAIAEQLLSDNGRQPWAALAAYLGVVAAWRSDDGRLDPALLDAQLTTVAHSLDVHGWRNEVLEVRTVQSRLAIERGALDEARQHLGAASRMRRRASAGQRAQAALVQALLHEADGETAAALGQARRGLDAVDGQRSGLGSSELRAASSAAATPLVELGLRITIGQARPGAALRWAERGRAVALTAPPTEPPNDPTLAAALTELRELHVARRDGSDVDTRMARLEHEILRRRRLDPGDPDTAAGRLSITAIRARLRGAVLVEYIESAGSLHAVVVDSRRSLIVRIASMDDVSMATDHVLFSLRRLSMMPAGHPRLSTARDALVQAAVELDRLLLGPVAQGRAERLVIVPTGRLHLVPWMTLPAARRGAVLVAPSATWWMGGVQRDRQDTPTDTDPDTDGGGVLVVGGPQLDHVDSELAELGDIYGRHVVLTGRAATVAEVLRRLEDSDVAHIAAHGHFRADSPMFSSLQMHDGPLNIHDLQGLRHVPRLVVLTACDAGRNGVLAGDELLGTVAALLSLGVSTVIAPLLPLADQPAAQFAVALHRQLIARRAPADALAVVAEAANASGDGAAIAAAQSFLCIGTSESDSVRISNSSGRSVLLTSTNRLADDGDARQSRTGGSKGPHHD